MIRDTADPVGLVNNDYGPPQEQQRRSSSIIARLGICSIATTNATDLKSRLRAIHTWHTNNVLCDTNV